MVAMHIPCLQVVRVHAGATIVLETKNAHAQQAKRSAEKAITQVTTKIHKAAKSGKTSCKVLRRCAGNLDRNH